MQFFRIETLCTSERGLMGGVCSVDFAAADIDGDGSVNVPDLMYLADDWIVANWLH